MEKLATVLTEDAVGRLSVIEHQGQLWLVTEWLFHKTRPVKRPKRIIRMSGLQYEETPSENGADYLINQPIPKGVLLGHVAPKDATGLVVIDGPNLEFEVPKRH